MAIILVNLVLLGIEVDVAASLAYGEARGSRSFGAAKRGESRPASPSCFWWAQLVRVPTLLNPGLLSAFGGNEPSLGLSLVKKWNPASSWLKRKHANRNQGPRWMVGPLQSVFL